MMVAQSFNRSVNRTKVVCTLGPSSNTISMITAMLRAGMDAARLNFSHRTRAEHRETLRYLRRGEKVVMLGSLRKRKGKEAQVATSGSLKVQ